MTQQFDKRNKDIHVWINGSLIHRNEAKKILSKHNLDFFYLTFLSSPQVKEVK